MTTINDISFHAVKLATNKKSKDMLTNNDDEFTQTDIMKRVAKYIKLDDEIKEKQNEWKKEKAKIQNVQN